MTTNEERNKKFSVDQTTMLPSKESALSIPSRTKTRQCPEQSNRRHERPRPFCFLAGVLRYRLFFLVPSFLGVDRLM